jgi:FKBP-type peptidyl-prolyl cis-trans isomerase 2
MPSPFQPGDRVVLETEPDWGEGQVQSAIGDKVTVNFEHAGKRTLDVRYAQLRKAKP